MTDQEQDQDPRSAPAPNLSGFGNRGGALAQQLSSRKPKDEGKQPAPTEGATEEAKEARASEQPQPVEQRQEEPQEVPPPPALTETEPETRTQQEPPPRPQSDEAAVKVVSPTVLSVETSIVRRFEKARKTAPSHTALILDALRRHHQELPDLIRKRRPTPPPETDLFPWRTSPGERPHAEEDKLPLRIRPLKAELEVIDQLRDHCRDAVDDDVTRSEMVAAALDAYLPQPGRRKRT